MPLAESVMASLKVEIFAVRTSLGEAIQRVNVEASVSSLFG